MTNVTDIIFTGVIILNIFVWNIQIKKIDKIKLIIITYDCQHLVWKCPIEKNCLKTWYFINNVYNIYIHFFI